MAKKGRILIIDDQPSARAWACRILESEFTCFETGSVQEFFELALRERPDAILADLEMQPLDGLKLCRMAKANPALASVPFVLLTAHETAEDKITSLADGADDHLPKSITPRELLSRMRATVRLRGAMLHAANLEGLVDQRTAELRATTERLAAEVLRRESIEAELRLAQKLEAVGQLAAGVAHELNTPLQYIGDSVDFLRSAFNDLLSAFDATHEVLAAPEAGPWQATLGPRLDAISEAADLTYLRERVPQAFELTRDGVDKASSIVRAMKELVNPGAVEKTHVDLHVALRNALIVAHHSYKDIADVETDFGELPAVECHVSELNQVFLNLIANAADAIASVSTDGASRGKIRVRTRRTGERASVTIEDTGPGIPEAIRERIFDPFFTTKPVGKGTGQGLAIARAIVVDKHGGRLTFSTELGKGSAFTLELPLEVAR